MITLELPCWHDGCLHLFHLACPPEDVSINNADILTHLLAEHDGAGVVLVS